MLRKRYTKHGVSRCKEYYAWRNMMLRCYDTNHPSYPDYGGRGLRVHKEWHDVVVFVRWAKRNGCAPGRSLDRRDNRRGYSPANCRWTSPKMQAANRRDNHRVVYKGRRYRLIALAKILRIDPELLRSRVRRHIPEKWWAVPKRRGHPFRNLNGTV